MTGCSIRVEDLFPSSHPLSSPSSVSPAAAAKTVLVAASSSLVLDDVARSERRTHADSGRHRESVYLCVRARAETGETESLDGKNLQRVNRRDGTTAAPAHNSHTSTGTRHDDSGTEPEYRSRSLRTSSTRYSQSLTQRESLSHRQPIHQPMTRISGISSSSG